jgi:hypothetical protein
LKTIVRSLLLAAAASLSLNGCIYLNATYPLDTNMNRTPVGTKVGTSSLQSVLWLFAWGDAGTQAAARNGGITVIHNADDKDFVILGGLYAKRTTIVYGD